MNDDGHDERDRRAARSHGRCAEDDRCCALRGGVPTGQSSATASWCCRPFRTDASSTSIRAARSTRRACCSCSRIATRRSCPSTAAQPSSRRPDACCRCCRTTSSITTASRSPSWSPTRSSMRRMPRRSVRASYAGAACRHRFRRRRAQMRTSRKEAGRKPADVTWGDLEAAERAAEVRVDVTYSTPMQNHNPMEPHATVARMGRRSPDALRRDAVRLRRARDRREDAWHVRRPTCASSRHSSAAASAARAPSWSHVVLAAMAREAVQRPVKLVVDAAADVRAGRRSPADVAADRARRRRATVRSPHVRHEVVSHTSDFEDFVEPSALQSRRCCTRARTA